MKKILKYIRILIKNPFVILRPFFSLFIYLISSKQSTTFLGTPYGGWDFIDMNILKNCTILSAGAGEDISFDIEFMNKYNSKVIIVDPTPRALKHIEEVLMLVGNDKIQSYDLSSGSQNPKSYNLKNIKKENISIVKKALTNKDNETIKFYPPGNTNDVSFSIVNSNKNSIENLNFIEVETTTVSSIIESFKLTKLPLIKLDIEGAEIDVLNSFLDENIKPSQILVEFDELQNYKLISYWKSLKTIQKLLNNNYKMIRTHKFKNFLFVNNFL